MSIHKLLSYLKSAVRVIGYYACALAFGDNMIGFFGCIILIVAEIFGFFEEMDEK
jgi:hypothetical protein